MRFIFLTQGYHPDIDGGAYRYAADVAELLAARGHEVHVIAKNPGNALSDMELRRGVRLYRINGTDGGFRSNWKEINRETRARVKRLLHETNDATLLATHHAYFEPSIRGFEKVSFLHGPWALEHRIACEAHSRGFFGRMRDRLAVRTLHQIEGRSLGAARRIFVASRYVADSLKSWHPGISAPVVVVGGGVNHQKFSPPSNRADLRRQQGLGDGDFLILAVRRLDPRMGLIQLVDGFAAVAAVRPNARLWIAGKGAQREELEARIEAAGLKDRARLLGFVEERELPALYASADLVVMPSLDLEGFGLVTAEAMACGTPVIAARTGANAEVIGGFDARLLFESGKEPLAAMLKSILEGRLELPVASRIADHARERFRWDTAADAFEHAWDEFAIPPEIPVRK